MKTWKQIRGDYEKYLLARALKRPDRRLSALKSVEKYLQATYPSLIKGLTLFAEINKNELKTRFAAWKGKEINGAENQVINDFYRLAHSRDH